MPTITFVKEIRKKRLGYSVGYAITLTEREAVLLGIKEILDKLASEKKKVKIIIEYE